MALQGLARLISNQMQRHCLSPGEGLLRHRRDRQATRRRCPAPGPPASGRTWDCPAAAMAREQNRTCGLQVDAGLAHRATDDCGAPRLPVATLLRCRYRARNLPYRQAASTNDNLVGREPIRAAKPPCRHAAQTNNNSACPESIIALHPLYRPAAPTNDNSAD